MSVDHITSMQPEKIESNLDSIYEKMNQGEIKKMVEENIQSISDKIPALKWKTAKEIYERFWWKYSEKPEELAKVFSYVFIKHRDSIDISDNFVQVKLQNVNSTLSIRQNWEIENIIGSLNDGITIKSLWESQEYNGLNYIKIEFFWNKGDIKNGYIAEHLVRNIDETNLKNLNWYIRSLGLNPTKQLKKETFQKVYFLKDYNENKTRDNHEVYHKLVQDYELRKLIQIEEYKQESLSHREQVKTEIKTPVNIINTNREEETINLEATNIPNTQDDIADLKTELSDVSKYSFIPKIADIFNYTKTNQQEEIEIPFRPDYTKQEEEVIIAESSKKQDKQTEEKATEIANIQEKETIPVEENTNLKESIKPPVESSNIVISENTQENNETLEQNAEFVLNKLKSNQNIVFYLENKYNSENFEENLEKFQKFIWSLGNDFKSLVMSYTYLFQHSYNNWSSIQLWDYYSKITWKNWWDLTSIDKNNLFKKYAWEVQEIYSWKNMSNNLTILRGLIIEHELWSQVEETIQEEKEKPIFSFEEHGLNPENMILPKSIYIDWEPYCSQTVREEYYLNRHDIKAIWTPAARIHIDRSIESWKPIYDRFSLKAEIINQFLLTWKNSFDVFPNTENWHRVNMEVGTDKTIHVHDPYNYKKGPVSLRQYFNIKKYPNMEFILENWYKISDSR